MQYLFIFVLISSFVLGVTTFVGALLLFGRRGNGRAAAHAAAVASRSKLSTYFLVGLCAYLLLMAGSTFLYYAEPFYARSGFGYTAILTLMRILTAVLIVSVVLFVQDLTGFPGTRRGRRVSIALLGILGIVFVLVFVHVVRTTLDARDALKFFDPSDLFVYAAMVYVIGLFLFRRHRIRHTVLKRVTTRFVVLAACSVPVLFADDLLLVLGVELDFLMFPIVYIAFNAFFLYEGYNHSFRRTELSHAGGAELSAERMRFYGITARERELIEQVALGLDNKTIGERLYISPATVRNHLHNAFEKTGARNRMELVRMLRASGGGRRELGEE